MILAVPRKQRNTAIAVLSADIANRKIGAVAPYFGEDREAFADAWIDGVNMPGAVFPEATLGSLQRELVAKRNDAVSRQMRQDTFGRDKR